MTLAFSLLAVTLGWIVTLQSASAQTETVHIPRDREARSLLLAGVDSARTGDLARAAEKFVRSLALNPNLAEAHYNLGIVRLNWTSWDAAIDSFRQALYIDSRYALAQLRLADAMTALAKERGSGWDDAISARTTRLLSWAWTRPKHTST